MRGGVDGEFSILDCGLDGIPILLEIYEEETEVDFREIALRNIWEIAHASINPQSEMDSVVGVLRKAIMDTDPVIWKCAIDGLVAIGGEGKKVLSESLPEAKILNDERHSWIVEALEQCD